MKAQARILFFSLAAGIAAAVLLAYGGLVYWAARWSARQTLEAYLIQEGQFDESDTLKVLRSRPYRDDEPPENLLGAYWTPWPGHWQFLIKVIGGSEFDARIYRVTEHGRYVYPIYIDTILGGPVPLYSPQKDGEGEHQLVYALTVAGGGILLISLGGLSIYALRQRLSPPRRVSAQVLEVKDCSYSQVIVGHYGLLNRRDNVVLFQAEGTTLGLFCSQELYDTLKKGARGLLTYRGSRALSFLQAGIQQNGRQ